MIAATAGVLARGQLGVLESAGDGHGWWAGRESACIVMLLANALKKDSAWLPRSLIVRTTLGGPRPFSNDSITLSRLLSWYGACSFGEMLSRALDLMVEWLSAKKSVDDWGVMKEGSIKDCSDGLEGRILSEYDCVDLDESRRSSNPIMPGLVDSEIGKESF